MAGMEGARKIEDLLGGSPANGGEPQVVALQKLVALPPPRPAIP
jgi:hypothetical protein